MNILKILIRHNLKIDISKRKTLKFLCSCLASLGVLLGLTQQAASQSVVSAASPEAARAGLSILQKGGNAADAAVAIAFALGVSEPAMSGLGGQIQILLKQPNSPPLALNGSSFAPGLTQPLDSRTQFLPLQRSTVPTWLKSLEYLFQEFGSGQVSWEETIAPALALARDGFRQGQFRHKVFLRHKADLSEFLDAGYMQSSDEFEEGSTIIQPQLAQTLEKIAMEGSDVFYSGEIAELIEEDMINRGGWIRKSDLARVMNPIEVQPLAMDYHGHTVYSFPPPAGGWVMMQTLALYEQLSKKIVDSEQPEELAMAKAIYLAQKNRNDEPVLDFEDYEGQIKQKLSDDYLDELLSDTIEIEGESADIGGETTHFSLIDKDGFAISATTSINAYYGAATASPGLGFLYNTYMDDFYFHEPTHPFAIKPFNQAFSSMSPALVTLDNDIVLALGSPGSARIISAVAQVIQKFIDTNVALPEILAQPRLHATASGGLYLEESNPNFNLDTLGLELRQPATDLVVENLNAYFGGIHAVGKRGQLWQGAADPRRDGISLSFSTKE
ncbi:MAG: gamma-glutamyltransferase [Pseudohongiellaceae bacterium]